MVIYLLSSGRYEREIANEYGVEPLLDHSNELSSWLLRSSEQTLTAQT